jgi:2-polyprenyl-3-methyl-5-hydroxy-6-metoxy-1,4-benzoquinol methylase
VVADGAGLPLGTLHDTTMASDYRADLYRGYVSTFKSQAAGGADDGAFVWWDHKFLPLLASLDLAADILDLGCGSGTLLDYLKRRGFSHVCGVDISAEQIELARRRGVRAEQHDALAYLAPNTERFDAVLAVDVFEHFTRDELFRLVRQIFSALKPRGRLIVQTANGAGLHPGQVIYGDLTHQTIFTPESLGQLLRTAGFDALAYYETGPIPVRLRGKLDVALWSAIKVVANAVRHVEAGKRQAIWTENFICRALKPG